MHQWNHVGYQQIRNVPLSDRFSKSQYLMHQISTLINLFPTSVLVQTDRTLCSDQITLRGSTSFLPAMQSAYRKHHLNGNNGGQVLNDVISATDNGQVTALVLLDLNTAFDCVNHEITIRVLNDRFQVEGQVLAWFLKFSHTSAIVHRLSESMAVMAVLSFCSRSTAVFHNDIYCLGPVEFISCTEDVVELMERHRVHHRVRVIFADDKYIGTSYRSPDPLAAL